MAIKPFTTAANKLASKTIAPNSATSIVKNILLTNGPQTTHSLHALLHSPQSSIVLPSRPPPANFLSGLKRTSYLSPSSSSSSSSSSSTQVPKASTSKLQNGFKESSNGIWSISYLKKNILKQMMEREEIFKITRGKFDNVSKRSSLPSSTTGSVGEVVGEVVDEVVGSLQSIVGVSNTTSKKVGKKSSNSKKSTSSSEEEHIWIVGDTWRSMLPTLPQEINPRKDSYVELKARQKIEKSDEMVQRERIGLRVVR